MTDDRLDVARRHAPVLYHEFDPECGRQDVPGPFDFDGNRVANDNWDDFPLHAIEPTVYYTVLETETHLFIAYHVFHPRDWAPITLYVQDTHENDGENLQVVVEKSTGEVVMLFTQAHFCGGVYVNDRDQIESADVEIRGPFTLEGTHPAVYVESQGHGIYGEIDPFEHGLILRAGDEAREPEPPYSGEATYVLESLPAKIGPHLLESIGDGKLFDGLVEYRGQPVPRYWDGDRFSGPLGNDRGISPYALDFGFSEPELGSLYYDPARRYADVLDIRTEWSTRYVR